MANSDSFWLASYSDDGNAIGGKSITVDSLDPRDITYFAERFEYLTDDLELPFEAPLPGDSFGMEFRICSVIDGAYVTYYFQDQMIFSSLLLSGADDELETELMEIFRFLTLDGGKSEDPSEEEIEDILENSSQFDFSKITQRPCAFEIPNHHEDELEQYHRAKAMNQNLAAAFFAIER